MALETGRLGSLFGGIIKRIVFFSFILLQLFCQNISEFNTHTVAVSSLSPAPQGSSSVPRALQLRPEWGVWGSQQGQSTAGCGQSVGFSVPSLHLTTTGTKDQESLSLNISGISRSRLLLPGDYTCTCPSRQPSRWRSLFFRKARLKTGLAPGLVSRAPPWSWGRMSSWLAGSLPTGSSWPLPTCWEGSLTSRSLKAQLLLL